MDSKHNESILVGPTTTAKPLAANKIFEKIARSDFANDVALVFEENGTTRQHLYSEIDTLTNRLARLIVQKIRENSLTHNSDGDYVIAVSMVPSDYLVMTLLAIWKSGAAYLPLDSSFPKQRVHHILEEAKPTMVLCDEDSEKFENVFRCTFSKLLVDCSKCSSRPLDIEECLPKSEDEIAIILYTSGSTGVPKGVRITHANIFNRLQWQFNTFPFSKTEKMGIFKTALSFVDSVSEIWGPLLNGLAVLVVAQGTTQNPEKLVKILEKHKIERLVLVPSLLKALLIYFQMNDSTQYVPLLKTWVCSGETLSKSLAVEFYNYFPSNEYRLCNFYGSTEIMGDVTYQIITSLEQLDQLEKIPIGIPIDNTITYLLDSNLNPVKDGEVGELYVAGLNLASGYVNSRDPEKFIENTATTDSKFRKLYRTGDYAKISNKTLLYEGRTDSQIKIRGYRVDISEVESAVYAIDGVEKAAVLCCNVGEPDQSLLAFVTTRTLSAVQIESLLKNALMSYMVPYVVVVDNIPLLVNGKIDRRTLLKDYEVLHQYDNEAHNGQQLFDYEGIPDRKMAIAKELFETVFQILNKPRIIISKCSNFYSIGGTSLNSISTITALRSKGYYISIEDFLIAVNLGEVLDKITPEEESVSTTIVKSPSYSTQNLSEGDKEIIIEMIDTSFCKKSEWSRYVCQYDSRDLICKSWDSLMLPENRKLSFIVKSKEGNVSAVSINFDAVAEPEFETGPNLALIFEFLEHCEQSVRENDLPTERGKTLHSFMMATHSSLTPTENVAIMQFMEEELLRLAEKENFEAVLTTNTSALTQQLGSDILKYETLANVKINEFVAKDGSMPFRNEPDSWRILVQRKMVKQV